LKRKVIGETKVPGYEDESDPQTYLKRGYTHGEANTLAALNVVMTHSRSLEIEVWPDEFRDLRGKLFEVWALVNARRTAHKRLDPEHNRGFVEWSHENRNPFDRREDEDDP
jgi:hypothetical protein